MRLRKHFLKAWDYSGQATLAESFTQMLQGSINGGKTASGKQSPFLPAEAERREKTGPKQWSNSSTTARGWQYTKHVPLPAVSLDQKLAEG